MANGRADHDPPHAMQLRAMLRREAAKDNEYRRDLLDAFPGQSPGQFLTVYYP